MDFFEFIEIMKLIPKPEQIDQLCKSNINFIYLENLSSYGYFKLLSPIQKYHLFSTACAYESIDIAMMLYKNDIDLDALKELMINFMADVGSNSEYVIFRWIWEQNSINFTQDEIIDCLIKIFKSGNIEFAEWFCSQISVDWEDKLLKQKIINEILHQADSSDDYLMAKFICQFYLTNTNCVTSN